MLTTEEVEQAQQDLARAVTILKAHRREAELDAKRALVGHYFKHIVRLGDGGTWPVYLCATGLEAELLVGWRFQQTPRGEIEIALERDLAPGFFAEQCREVERNEFVTAFNGLLTDVARFATRMPFTE